MRNGRDRISFTGPIGNRSLLAARRVLDEYVLPLSTRSDTMGEHRSVHNQQIKDMLSALESDEML